MENTPIVPILRHDGPGFKGMLDSDGWRIAFSNDAPHARKEAVTKVARHMETDEVFVLLAGRADLYVSDAEIPAHFTVISLEPLQAYVVPRKTWHSMVTYEGTRLFVTENVGTGSHNSEYYETTLP